MKKDMLQPYKDYGLDEYSDAEIEAIKWSSFAKGLLLGIILVVAATAWVYGGVG